MRENISVVMCTYNGEMYIEEQLNSILKQLNDNDEFIIIDDASNDNTYTLLKDFMLNYKIIKLYRNKSNIGFLKNFQKALALASRDIILLSDQDDIWIDNKINLIIDKFNSDSNIELIFTDAYLIDKSGNILNKSLWYNLGIRNPNPKNIFSILLKNNIATGATMGLKKKLIKKLINIPECWIHDGWFTIIASLENKVCPLEYKLIKYRQHDNNVIGANQKGLIFKIYKYFTNAKLIRDEIEEKNCRYIEVKQFIETEKINLSKKMVDDLNQCIEFWKDRKEISYVSFFKSLLIIIKLLLKGHYVRYSTGVNAMLKDLYILIMGK